MNKKFFTLIASAFMLVASLGTVNAQTINLTTGPVENAPFTKDKWGKNLYHLIGETGNSSFTGALSISATGNVAFEDAANFPLDFGRSLWCIELHETEDQGKNPTFLFTNKGSDAVLAVSQDDLLLTGTTTADSIDVRFGDLSRWDFSATYSGGLETKKPFILYYGADRILTFYRKSTGLVGVRSYSATLAADIAHNPGSYADVLYFTVQRPDEITLTAPQFNTIINTLTAEQFIALNFNPAPSDVSEFQTAIKAEDVTSLVDGTSFPLVIANSGNWLRFYQNTTNADKKYLRVDTAYTGAYGTKFLKFAFGQAPSQATPQRAAIEMQYYFQARYYVFNDSLAIDVMQATFPKEDYSGYWYTHPAKTIWDGHSASWLSSPNSADSLHLKLQDLIAGERSILTIGTREVSTRISFGMEGCKPVMDLASIPEDLYVIRNAKGQVLAVPVYTDSVMGRDNAPKWIDLPKNVDPLYMPAYQWVVKKTRSSNLEFSPVSVTNREYPAIYQRSLQLTENGSVTSLFGESMKPVVTDQAAPYFQKVPKALKQDPYLGYKYVSSDEARMKTYCFNYLHEFNDSYYLGVANADSFMYVKLDKTQFEILPQSTAHNYGINASAAAYKITDMAQLKRVAYVLKIKDASKLRNTNKVIVVDKQQKRYSVSKDPYTYGGDSAVFFLKVNNSKMKNGEYTHYYAMLDTNTWKKDNRPLAYANAWNQNDPIWMIKLGIDDNSTWALQQPQKESRTSAFSIEEWSEPLYRRFDNGVYGSRGIKELFGSKQNSPLFLKFMKQNNWETEFLFENSPNGVGNNFPTTTENDYRQDLTAKGKSTISFLGLYNIRQFPERGDEFSYSFYVDTAFVRRTASGSGTLDSARWTPKPQYMLALRPTIVTEDTIWTVSRDSTWTSSGNQWVYHSDTTMHVLPPFTRAFYLFNAQDSIGMNSWLNNVGDNARPHNADYVGKFAYGAEYTTRLAFVDGVHLRDTFYVLPENYKNISAITIGTDIPRYLYNLPWWRKHYLGENTHYKPRFDRLGVPAVYVSNGVNSHFNDAYNGKSMVFQFRLVDPEGVVDETLDKAKVRSFLIESRQHDIEMGPQEGRWIKVQNGVPVVSQNIDIVEAQQNGAEIFNVIDKDINKGAVSNETAPAVSGVKVIGEAGAVTILNAAGKTVAISNILGQTVANTTLTNDNQTIALPKGIVVVAVEGEAAVKAIVK